MPRSRDGVGNVESDCDTALLARGGGGGVFPDSDVPGLPAGIGSDVDSPPGSEGIAGSGGLGYIRPGAGSGSPFRDRPVTGSHLFGSAVCRVLGLWKPRLLLGLIIIYSW